MNWLSKYNKLQPNQINTLQAEYEGIKYNN